MFSNSSFHRSNHLNSPADSNTKFCNDLEVADLKHSVSAIRFWFRSALYSSKVYNRRKIK